MTDPNLTGTNPAADRRTMTEADLSLEERHIVSMSDWAFQSGWLQCHRKTNAIVAKLPIDAEAKTSVLLALIHLFGKPSTDAAVTHRRELVEMYMRRSSRA